MMTFVVIKALMSPAIQPARCDVRATAALAIIAIPKSQEKTTNLNRQVSCTGLTHWPTQRTLICDRHTLRQPTTVTSSQVTTQEETQKHQQSAPCLASALPLRTLNTMYQGSSMVHSMLFFMLWTMLLTENWCIYRRDNCSLAVV